MTGRIIRNGTPAFLYLSVTVTRHKLVAANITLQIGPSVAVGQRIGRLQSGRGVAREGEEAMLAVFMALRCGLPPPSNERRTSGDRGEDWHSLPLHREERETTRGRTIAVCDCGHEEVHVHPPRVCIASSTRVWEGVHGLAGMGGHTFFLVTPHKLSFTVPPRPRNCAPCYGPNRDYYSLVAAFNYDKIYDIALLLRLALISAAWLGARGPSGYTD